MFNEGYSGDVGLVAGAILLTRQLAGWLTDESEVAGLLALMLLHHARRTDVDGRLVPLAVQDRTRWEAALSPRVSDALHTALARDRLGAYQAEGTPTPGRP